MHNVFLTKMEEQGCVCVSFEEALSVFHSFPVAPS